MSEGVGGDLR